MVPSWHIPWAIFQQICEKWNHKGLPEGVQNQQRGQRMRMIHIVIMNIIQSDTDDNKVSVCAGFQPCLPCLSNVYIIYSLIQSNQSFYLCWVILSAVSFDMVFHYTEHTQMHRLELPSAFKLWFDIVTCLTKTICLTQWSQIWRPFTSKLFINAIDMLIIRIVLE